MQFENQTRYLDHHFFIINTCLCVFSVFFPSGDSRDIAKPATCHQGQSGLSTRAATALKRTSSATAGSAPTRGAAHRTIPPLLRWPSTAQAAECCSELWWWSTHVCVITTAPMRRTLTPLCGDTGPNRPDKALTHRLIYFHVDQYKQRMDPEREKLVLGTVTEFDGSWSSNMEQHCLHFSNIYVCTLESIMLVIDFIQVMKLFDEWSRKTEVI